MPVGEITKKEFDQLEPFWGPDVGTLILEKEWYSDQARNVIGALTFDTENNDWGYIIFGEDEEGNFRGIDLEVSKESPEQARNLLIQKLSELEESGQTMFPQD